MIPVGLAYYYSGAWKRGPKKPKKKRCPICGARKWIALASILVIVTILLVIL